ncbi:hypothetical protein LOAG_14046 [Loa loa]|uniref:Uncharacterized protein n=2 Tax=Loa loa TaxID=7209 RepID=A0A1S0TIX2_LOALO|nr:hypothetical protein LOAG_14046 [Loa loa]EFO14473.1 hypothetical protein LOAG_14046 [Loa loa]
MEAMKIILALLIVLLASTNVESYSWGYPYYGSAYYSTYRPFSGGWSPFYGGEMIGANFGGTGATLLTKK